MSVHNGAKELLKLYNFISKANEFNGNALSNGVAYFYFFHFCYWFSCRMRKKLDNCAWKCCHLQCRYLLKILFKIQPLRSKHYDSQVIHKTTKITMQLHKIFQSSVCSTYLKMIDVLKPTCNDISSGNFWVVYLYLLYLLFFALLKVMDCLPGLESPHT